MERSLISDQGAYPTAFAWKTYGGLTSIQLFLAGFMPGVTQNGLPVPSLDYATLPYLCNALISWYVTLIGAAVFYPDIHSAFYSLKNTVSVPRPPSLPNK